MPVWRVRSIPSRDWPPSGCGGVGQYRTRSATASAKAVAAAPPTPLTCGCVTEQRDAGQIERQGAAGWSGPPHNSPRVQASGDAACGDYPRPGTPQRLGQRYCSLRGTPTFRRAQQARGKPVFEIEVAEHGRVFRLGEYAAQQRVDHAVSGFAIRALDPALNGEVCRVTDQIRASSSMVSSV